jgi:hypothetical protein
MEKSAENPIGGQSGLAAYGEIPGEFSKAANLAIYGVNAGDSEHRPIGGQKQCVAPYVATYGAAP